MGTSEGEGSWEIEEEEGEEGGRLRGERRGYGVEDAMKWRNRE